MIARIRIDETTAVELRDDRRWYSDDPVMESIMRSGFAVKRFPAHSYFDPIALCVQSAAEFWGREPEFDPSYRSPQYDPDMI